MLVYDGYGVLYGFCVLLLLLCLGYAVGWPSRLPNRFVSGLLVSLLAVEAYNESVGQYYASARITNAGYLLLAVFVGAIFLSTMVDAALGLVALAALILLLAAAGIGGSDYGAAWLYSRTHFVMTTNAFLVVLITTLVLVSLLWWRCSRAPLFLWLVDTALLVFNNLFAFDVVLNGSAAFAAGESSYDVLTLNAWLGLDAALGLLWFAVPSMTAFALRARRRGAGHARDFTLCSRHDVLEKGSTQEDSRRRDRGRRAAHHSR